jgi:methionyl-tRNA formyltransferase
MAVLFLGPASSQVLKWLLDVEEVKQTDERLTTVPNGYDYLVSHRYRHILPPHICDSFEGRAVNLHTGFLPWNRGADPDLWSLIDGTPRGVTIHYISAGLDKGDIISQALVGFSADDTLASAKQKLQDAMLPLFVQWWPLIKSGNCQRLRPVLPGTYHRSADKERLAHLLVKGWDTPISALYATAPSSARN